MNKLLFLLFALFFCSVSVANDDKQQDAVAAQPGQLMLADPFILEHDGWYYIYGTESANGIVVYRSRDLKTWSSLCGNAKENLAMHKDDVWGSRYFWAPEVYKRGDKFIMTYSAHAHICCAESDSPCGPFTQKEQRPYLPEEGGIDASIFVDDDGKAYMFWVRFGEGNLIWVAEMSDDLMTVKKETARKLIECEEGTWEKQMGNVAEGPFVLKHKGKYYLTYSCNDYRCQDYAVGFAVADNPMGPYKRYDKNPVLRRHCGYAGTGHHAIFRVGKRYYMVYHAHKSHTVVEPRQTLIAPIKIRRDKDGGKGAYRIEVSEKIIVPKIVK